ncbi:MAG: helix-turn-helix domain-containing protein [Chryseolinea sp.]
MHQALDQFFKIIINGGIVLGIFVVLLLNSKDVRKSRANIFLSILLIAFTFSIFHTRYAGDVLSHFAVRTFLVGDPTFLLITPLLWFYLIELTGGKVKISAVLLLHFVPFLFVCFSSLYLQGLPSASPVLFFLGRNPKLPIIFFWLLVVTQFLCYHIFIHRKWQAYQQLIKQEKSNTENVNVSWIRFFVGVFLIINVFFLISLAVVIHMQYTFWIWRAVGVIFSFSVFALGYKGILQREVFHPALDEASENTQPSQIESPKPDQQLIEKLVFYMADRRPYLDSELSLSSLARELGINRSLLSQVINNGIGDNFYDFVNKYRVEEVKRLMTDPRMSNFNLLGIALEAGFKSKSTFNLIFKRFTGLTPSEYRKNIFPS